jgi:hypothetical protein
VLLPNGARPVKANVVGRTRTPTALISMGFQNRSTRRCMGFSACAAHTTRPSASSHRSPAAPRSGRPPASPSLGATRVRPVNLVQYCPVVFPASYAKPKAPPLRPGVWALTFKWTTVATCGHLHSLARPRSHTAPQPSSRQGVVHLQRRKRGSSLPGMTRRPVPREHPSQPLAGRSARRAPAAATSPCAASCGAPR